MMKEAGVSKVYYSTEKGDIVKERVADMKSIHDSVGTRLIKLRQRCH
jgi:hypothetical protein